MMKNFPLSKKQITWSLIVLCVGFFLYFIFHKDPLEEFRREMQKMAQTLNEYKHAELEEKFSPQMVAWIENESLSPRQALALARNMDFSEKRQYRLVQVLVFHSGDYAETQFQRSEPDGKFEDSGNFRVPFIFLQGKWKVTPYNKLGEENIEIPH